MDRQEHQGHFAILSVAAQLWLAFNHLLGRIPVRLFLLVVNGRFTRPPKALASNTDTVSERASITLDEVKEVILRVDNNRAGRLVRRIHDDRAKICRIYIGQAYGGDGKG